MKRSKIVDALLLLSWVQLTLDVLAMIRERRAEKRNEAERIALYEHHAEIDARCAIGKDPHGIDLAVLGLGGKIGPAGEVAVDVES